jgi:4'-phosphopantetheinyl transferase
MQSGVEVWTARPDGLGCGACAELAALLDPAERERAAQFRFDADRRAFVVAHAMRRIALGLALAVDPQDLRFTTGPHGQPLLLDFEDRAPSFSLTRSRGFVAFALSGEGVVGIDVEAERDGADPALLEPYMHLQDPDGAGLDFYAQWTAIEAFWKARGLGLSAGNPRISLHAVGDDCFEVLLGDGLQSAGMVVIRLPAADGYVLSLACGEVSSVRIVELDSLAPAPRAEPQKAFASCKARHCASPAASTIFSS